MLRVTVPPISVLDSRSWQFVMEEEEGREEVAQNTILRLDSIKHKLAQHITLDTKQKWARLVYVHANCRYFSACIREGLKKQKHLDGLSPSKLDPPRGVYFDGLGFFPHKSKWVQETNFWPFIENVKKKSILYGLSPYPSSTPPWGDRPSLSKCFLNIP